MTSPEPLKVRLVDNPASQLAAAAATAAVVLAVVLWTRRRHYAPLFATRTARKLRQLAQRLEDLGLDVARRDMP